MSSQRHYRSLDGLRAVSIVLVLIFHSYRSFGFPFSQSLGWLDLGNLGVRFFFVISGFLITSLLLKELGARGTVSLRNFYFRRFLRIFPAFYFYLIVVFLLIASGLVAWSKFSILRAALYSTNYHLPGKTWLIGHTWSLSVEEQFYLLWPVVLLKLRPKRASVTAIFWIVAVAAFRVIAFELIPWYQHIFWTAFECVSDALAMGCLLALIRDRLHGWDWYCRALSWPGTVPSLVALCLLAYSAPAGSQLLWLAVGIPVANVSIAIILDQCITVDSACSRFLNLPPVSAIGVLSYSLYLWQQPFLVQGRWRIQPWHWFPLSWMLAFGAAWCSYHWVEKPFLAWREKLRMNPAPSSPVSRSIDPSSAPALTHAATVAS